MLIHFNKTFDFQYYLAIYFLQITEMYTDYVGTALEVGNLVDFNEPRQ